MRKFLKALLIVIVVFLVLIQFYPKAKNVSSGTSPNDISTKYKVPEDVNHILTVACNDCHSNNTRYPWNW